MVTMCIAARLRRKRRGRQKGVGSELALRGRVVLEAVTVTPREARREIIRNAARRDRAVLRRLAEYDRK